MDITTVEDNKRVICEHSYYRWWQMKSPSFREVLIKINEECRSQYDPIYNLIPQPNNEPPIEEFACSIHGVRATIVKVITSASTEIKTHMVCYPTAKHDWIHYQMRDDDLFIPYFQDFLINLRKVWYEQNGKP